MRIAGDHVATRALYIGHPHLLMALHSISSLSGPYQSFKDIHSSLVLSSHLHIHSSNTRTPNHTHLIFITPIPALSTIPVETRRTTATPPIVEDAAAAAAAAAAATRPFKSSRTRSARPRSSKTKAPRRAPSRSVRNQVPNSVSSSGTVTLHSRPSTPPISQRDYRNLRNRLERIEDERHSRHRVHKSRSRRYRRYRRYSLSNSSTDLEEGDRLIVLFLYIEGKRPFLTLHNRYRSVKVKYFK